MAWIPYPANPVAFPVKTKKKRDILVAFSQLRDIHLADSEPQLPEVRT